VTIFELAVSPELAGCVACVGDEEAGMESRRPPRGSCTSAWLRVRPDRYRV